MIACTGCGRVQVYKVLSLDAAGLNIAYLAGLSGAYCLLAIIIDYSIANPWIRKHLFTRPSFMHKRQIMSAEYVDVDVAAEQQRVLSGGANEDVLVIKVRGLPTQDT